MEGTVVLVVDEDEPVRLETANLVREGIEGVSVLTANSVATATDTLDNQSVDVLVTGYNLPEENGLVLADTVRDRSPGTGTILYTKAETVETESFEDVVVEFLAKDDPNATEELLALIEQAGPEQTQAAHPVPENEPARLEATERALLASEQVLEPLQEIATLTRDHFETSAGAVGFVLRDRQEVLANSGEMELPTVREDSLATHTIIAEDGVLAVEDTRTDPRFSEIPEIQSVGIRSYLGAAISTPEGHVVGTLSVYDERPREFTPADYEYIKRLGTLAGEILALATGGDSQ